MRNISIIISISLVLLLALAGCNSNASSEDITRNAVNNLDSQESNLDTQERTINIDKLEIYHFHGTSQCYSCVTMGDYAEATVNTYFADELKSGKIVFGHINGELLENRELVTKYGATGSSLWLGMYDDNGFHPEENINVWYKINDKQAYMDYLKDLIERRLTGDLN